MTFGSNPELGFVKPFLARIRFGELGLLLGALQFGRGFGCGMVNSVTVLPLF